MSTLDVSLDKMNISDNNTDKTAAGEGISTDDVSICANCGKEGTDLKACTACKLVKYCNRECQIAHRPQYKKECRRRAAELHDEKLFKQPPSQHGDCPICFLRLPTLVTGTRYMLCCGKTICCGCAHAPVFDDQGNKGDIIKQNECPFCRTLAPKTDEESIKRLNKRIEANDARAMYNKGCCYRDGTIHPQDFTKALELWHRASDLGYTEAYTNIGYAYEIGRDVEVDKKRANHSYELAAMSGSVEARHNLGLMEFREGNIDRALKHYMIAVGSGYSTSMEHIKALYSSGYATKEDYTNALRSYQEYLGEIKSKQRDEAAAEAEDENYRYY